MQIEEVLLGNGKEISRSPFDTVRRQLEEATRIRSPRLAFMNEAHHRVRDFAVVEMARSGGPLEPAAIAEGTGIEPARVSKLLDELESRLFFLVRDEEGRVSWAFPVTSEETPHRVELSTGETVYAA